MLNFWIKTGSLWPPLGVTFGLAISGGLTGATVRFRMMDEFDLIIIDAPATAVDAANQEYKYVWQSLDTVTPGNFWGEFWITLATGEVIKLPVDGYINIIITDDLTP